MSRGAVILGRSSADLVTSLLSIAVTLLCGLAIGWRMTNGLGPALVAMGLLLLFTFAVSWVGAVIALTARSVEVAQSLGLIWLFPVTFISGAFVSVQSMPGPLRTFAEWNPVTAVATRRAVVRQRCTSGFCTPGGWPADNALLYAVLCCVAIIAIFAPLAISQYCGSANGEH